MSKRGAQSYTTMSINMSIIIQDGIHMHTWDIVRVALQDKVCSALHVHLFRTIARVERPFVGYVKMSVSKFPAPILWGRVLVCG